MKQRWVPLIASVAVLASGAFAVVALSARTEPATGGGPSVQLAGPDSGGQVTPTPTLVVSEDATIANARGTLAQQNPQWASFFAAVESGNVSEVFGFLRWQTHPCTPGDSHGGDATACKELALSDGSKVAMFPEDYSGAIPLPYDAGLWYQDEGSLRKEFAQLLANRRPVLELVANGDKGDLYVSFSLGPAPHPISGALVLSVGFYFSNQSDVVAHSFAQGVASTTPFETLRSLARDGHPYQIVGVADQLRQRDRAIHIERYESPAHTAPPRQP